LGAILIYIIPKAGINGDLAEIKLKIVEEFIERKTPAVGRVFMPRK